MTKLRGQRGNGLATSVGSELPTMACGPDAEEAAFLLSSVLITDEKQCQYQLLRFLSW